MSGHLGDRISPLIDGQLDHDDRDRAFAHLARCADCQREVIEHRMLKARLAALSAPEIPARLTEKLLKLGAVEFQPQVPARPRRPVYPRRIRRVVPSVRPDSAARALPAARPAAGIPGPGPFGLAAPGLAPASGGGTMVAFAERVPPAADRPAPGGRHSATPPGAAPPGDTAFGAPALADAAPRHAAPVDASLAGAAAAGRRRRRPSFPVISAPFGGRSSSSAPASPRPAAPDRRQTSRRPLAGTAHSRGRRRRMRRALVGSAALMLLVVTGSVIADGRPAPRTPGPTMVPAVASTVGQPPGRKTAANPEPIPTIATVSVQGRP